MYVHAYAFEYKYIYAYVYECVRAFTASDIE